MKQFDFNQVGKRMPYSVPDGFFDQLEADVYASLSEKESDSVAEANSSLFTLPSSLKRVLLAVAAVALFFVVQPLLPKEEADNFDSVQLAYNNLSAEDQEFLTEIYEEDDFINNITNTDEYEENI